MNGFGAIKWLARVGFLVKGVLYMVIGALALQVAAKAGGRVTGTRGALTTVLGQPFGRTLLLVVVVGLLGYAAWRILQGLFDPDRLGNKVAWPCVLWEISSSVGTVQSSPRGECLHSRWRARAMLVQKRTDTSLHRC